MERERCKRSNTAKRCREKKNANEGQNILCCDVYDEAGVDKKQPESKHLDLSSSSAAADISSNQRWAFNPNVMAEVLSAIAYIKDPNVRSQFECLVEDFKSMIYQDDNKDPHFLEYIKKWLHKPTTKPEPTLGKTTLQKINVNAYKKLMEAKVLQRQVAEINEYFSSIAHLMPEEESVQPKGQTADSTVQPAGEHRLYAEQAADCRKAAGDASQLQLGNQSLDLQECHRYPGDAGEMNPPLEQVQILLGTAEDRRRRVEALKECNEILSAQIDELTMTLEASESHLESLKTNKSPLAIETLRRELCTFQESIFERIISCIEILYSQLSPLQNTVAEQSHKAAVTLANYEKLKQEEVKVNSRFVGSDIGSTVAHPAVDDSRDMTRSESCKEDIYTVMKAVMEGINVFQGTCTNLWERSLKLVSDETELLLNLSKITTSSHSITSEELEKLKVLPEDKSKYDEVLASLLQTLESIAREFSRLMIVTRLRDLQLISLDHRIGLVYLALEQKIATLTNTKKPDKQKKSEPLKIMETVPHKKSFTPADGMGSQVLPTISAQVLNNDKNKPITLLTATLLPGLQTESVRKGTHGMDSPSPKKKNDDPDDLAEVQKKVLTGLSSRDRALHMVSAADLKFSLDSSPECQRGSLTGNNSSLSSLDQMMSPWPSSSKRLHRTKSAEFSRVANKPHMNSIMKTAVGSRKRMPAPKRQYFPRIAPTLMNQIKCLPRNNLTSPNSQMSRTPYPTTLLKKIQRKTPGTRKKPKTSRKATSQKSSDLKKAVSPKPQYIKKVADFRDEYGCSVDSMGIPADTTRKTIHYNRLLPTPTPPSIIHEEEPLTSNAQALEPRVFARSDPWASQQSNH